jgi:hypothetical protein
MCHIRDRTDGARTRRENGIDLQPHQFRCVLRKSWDISLVFATLDPEILPLGISALTHSGEEEVSKRPAGYAEIANPSRSGMIQLRQHR